MKAKPQRWWALRCRDGSFFRYLGHKRPEQFDTKEHATKFKSVWVDCIKLIPVLVELKEVKL